MSFERIAIGAIFLGLVLICQPWSHFLFVAGFPLAVLGLIANNFAAWFGGAQDAASPDAASVGAAASGAGEARDSGDAR